MSSTITRDLPGQAVFGFAVPPPRLGRRAWRAVVEGFEPHIFAADTRGKVHGRVFKKLHDLGYYVKWGSIRVSRAPEYDAYWKTDPSNDGCEEYDLLEFRRPEL